MKYVLSLLTLFCLFVFSLPLAAQNPPPRGEDHLRIMSYNVHNCIGADKRKNYDRVAAIISECDPDVVALQELDSMTIRHRKHVLSELARRTQMHATYASTLKFMGGRYGIGILSKEKPLNIRRIPLPGKEEKRMLLMAEFERYIVLCTHFSLTVRDRIASVGIILDVVENIEKPVFLAGDMNDTHNTEMQRRLMERFTVLNDPEQATLGSGSDERCVDYIYGLDNGALWSALGRGVIPETVASDHRPVWVDVRLTSNAKP